MLEDVVCNSNEGIFFTEHRTIFTNHSEAVNIGVNNETDVVAALTHKVADFCEVFLQGFGIVSEVTSGFCIEVCYLCYTELTEELGNDYTTYRVYSVECYREVSATDSFNIYEFKFLHMVDVTLVVVEVLCVVTEVVYISEVKVAVISEAHYFSSFFGGKEFALFVEELKCIPLTGVVARCDDDTTYSLFHSYSKFCSRRRSKTDVHNIEAHTHKRTTNSLAYHFARDTCVTTNDDLLAVSTNMLFTKTCISRNRLCNFNGVQGVSGTATDGATET